MELATIERHLGGMQGAVLRFVAVSTFAGSLLAQQGYPDQGGPEQGGPEQGGAGQAQSPVDPAQAPGGAQQLQRPFTGNTLGPFRNLNISLDLLTAIGGSTERDEQILELQGGEHDPRKRGITIQQAELQINGEVDDWLTAQGVMVMFLEPDTGETVVELEEAFLQTANLPSGFQFKAGHYFTEFGRVNPLHPHAWDWQDQPVILSRVFGAEGMRAPGARVSWLAPTHHYLEFFLAGQNGNGETMTSFLANEEAYEEGGIGGRFFNNPGGARSGGDIVWSGRVATTLHMGPDAALGIGASVIFGPNATGNDADTTIGGVDFAYQSRPANAVGVSDFVRFQGEYIWRAFDAASQVDTDTVGNPVLPGETLRDHGGYLYGLVGWDNGWGVGMRAEYASGSAQSYLGGGNFARDGDAFRADRFRLSPLVQYQVSPTSRIRLQYNYDDSDHLANRAHSVWLGFEVILGTQPPSRTGRDGLSGCSCR